MASTVPPVPGFSETVVHVASEYWPYASSGGLAAAVRGIARHQSRSGVVTHVIMPLHRRIRENFPWIEVGFEIDVPVGDTTEHVRCFTAPAANGHPTVTFIEHPAYFDRPNLYGEAGRAYDDNHLRFAFFCRAALALLPRLSATPPLVHVHDWHTALALIYLRTTLKGQPYFDRTASVMTVHNAGYQGYYGRDVLAPLGIDARHFHWRFMEAYGQVNLLKGGLVCADMVTTVSPTHARELCTETGGFGLHGVYAELGDRLHGILNGVEGHWDPAHDGQLEATFDAGCLEGKVVCKRALQRECGLSADPRKPLVAMSARLVQQKGFDLLLDSALVETAEAQWIFLGEGEPYYHRRLAALARATPDRVAVRFEFTEDFEHRLLGGADVLVMPSLYEPCGITQLRAQRYGAVPVARRVGGLADTIEDGVTGFLFDEYEPSALRSAFRKAMRAYNHQTAWTAQMRLAMGRDFGWDRSVARYQEVYRKALRRRVEA